MMRLRIGMIAMVFWFVASAAPLLAGDSIVKSIDALYESKMHWKGQRIQIKGKVVKINTGIMGKNFFHIQDGSGKNGTNDLTVTTNQDVHVGDVVVVTGLVTLDRNFGAGYSYPLILEEATVERASGH